VRCLPNSYKIWHNYLSEFIDYCSQRSLLSKEYNELNKLFERCLTQLPKLPRIWMIYAESLANQNLISRARFVYNWSFKNLPLTQHEKIWAKYAPWVLSL
jgi:pre-mRNA-splicing factor SYF1